MTVQTPYHFVPLSKWVYMPDWAHLVSHDVPFEDGVSGVIEYTLTNHTPLCVGDTKDENGVLKFARNPSGELVIPSSSLKGMIRSVLEIATFGKFSAVDDRKFSYRDISSNSDYLNNVINPNEVTSGWIKFNQDKNIWQFFQCDHGKIYHSDLNKLERVTIKNVLTAMKKYEQLPLSRIIKASTSYNSDPKKISKVTNVGHGKVAGNCVFTHNRILGKGSPKDYEFSYFFYNKKTESYSEDISDLVKDLFANHRGLVTSEKEDSDLVSFLEKNQNPEHGIPVFALKIQEKITCFGFAKMPRVTYKNSTVDLIKTLNPAHVSTSYFDMAELMFGTLRDQELSLKSRIYFSDAVNSSKPQTYPSKRLVLSEPRATFYPAYLEQPTRGKLLNYNDSATLSGAKRYISKAPQHDDLAAYSESNQKISQSFELCPTGEKFSGKIIFHNLKQVELSALLWCLNLQGSYHQLGHGKPFGAGTVKISAQLTHWRTNSDKYTIENDLETLFEATMEKHYPSSQENSWKSSPQLTYLLELGKLEQNIGINTSYMPLDDFQEAKNKKWSLPHFKKHSRTEASISPASEVSLSFGQGRLSRLINEDPSFEKEQLDRVNAKFDEIKMQQKRDAMTEHELHFHDLLADFEDIDPTEKPPRLRKAIYFYIENIDSSARDFALQLHQIANENDFRKKPKKRVEEHKKILVKLNKLYKLNL